MQSPVAWSRLASRVWRVARPFGSLALLAIVFGTSLSVVQFAEYLTPFRRDSALVATTAPEGPDGRVARSDPGQGFDTVQLPESRVEPNPISHLTI